MSKPKVSVVSISYNQEAYIAQALESFVSQEADFLFEVVICDDNSTDNTAKIIKEYAAKYPEIIKPKLRRKNIGIENNLVDALKRARGEYIALCEGDDFWTDPSKLQRQADFLDKRNDYSIVFHPVDVFFENDEQDGIVYPAEKNGFTVEELLRRNFIQTNSVMYRAGSGYGADIMNMLPVDWYIHLYFAQFGKIGFIDRTMSSYRKHHGGVWWSSADNEGAFLKKIFKQHVNFFNAVETLYGNSDTRRAIVRESREKFIKHAVSLNIEDELFVREAADLVPNEIASIVLELHEIILEADKLKQSLRSDLDESRKSYDALLNSTTYRLGQAIAKPVRSSMKIFQKR